MATRKWALPTAKWAPDPQMRTVSSFQSGEPLSRGPKPIPGPDPQKLQIVILLLLFYAFKFVVICSTAIEKQYRHRKRQCYPSPILHKAWPGEGSLCSLKTSYSSRMRKSECGSFWGGVTPLNLITSSLLCLDMDPSRLAARSVL